MFLIGVLKEMSCREGIQRVGERVEFRRVGAGEELHSAPAEKNGVLVADAQLDIDKKLLIDPKLLFVGSKIGEGAHGKVYEGK